MIGDNGENRLINYRPLFEFALGMMAGILLCSFLKEPISYVFAAALAISGGALMMAKRHRFAVLALAVLIGFSTASIALPFEFDSGNARISGIVCEIEEKDGSVSAIIDKVELDGAQFNKRAKLKFDGMIGAGELKIGNAIEANASVREPNRRFSSYDERKTMLSKGIGCIAEAREVAVTGEHGLPVAEFLHGIRNSVEQRIRLAFEDDSGLFTALLLGVRNELSDERAEAYRSSGTAHLLAISGFHMGIIVGAISLLIPKRRRVMKLIIILMFAGAYCTVAAYTPGIVRAAIMTACVLAANALERRGDTLSALSLAAILILLFNPFQLYSLGFQFSFAAVFGIAIFGGSAARKMRGIGIPAKLSSALAVTLCASAGTLMFQLRYYSSFTPYSALANLFAVPAFSLVIVFGFITTLIAFIFPAAAPIIATVPRAILFAVEKLLLIVSKLPLASVDLAPPSAAACLLYLLLLFVASEYVIRRKLKRLEFAVPILILFTFSYLMGIINA